MGDTPSRTNQERRKLRPADAKANAVIEELISNLCDQIDKAEDKAARWGQELMAERKRANEAERARDAAINALRPFAAIGAPIGEGWSDERRVATLNIQPVRVRDFRLAVALVAANDAGDSRKDGAPPQDDGDA